MKIILEFKHKDINDIRVDYIEDTVNTLLLEKEELDKNITLYWEKKDIYVWTLILSSFITPNALNSFHKIFISIVTVYFI